MGDQENYRRLASHSMQLAGNIFPRSARDHFVEMAQYWTKLARKANSDALSSEEPGTARPFSSAHNVDT